MNLKNASRITRITPHATPHRSEPQHPGATAHWVNKARIVLLPALLLTLVLGVVGCGTTKPKPVAWTIKITKPAGIEVDLVGVTAREKPRLESYSVDKYWSPGDLERNTAMLLELAA